MTEIMPSLQNLINLSYDPRRKSGVFFMRKPALEAPAFAWR